MTDQPPEFSLAESAISMHEMFSSLRSAGFTEKQALYICTASLRACPTCGGEK